MKKLKKQKKFFLFVVCLLLCLLSGLLLFKGIDNLNQIAKKCDQARGHTCSYYEIRQYVFEK